jgi:plastocyanin
MPTVLTGKRAHPGPRVVLGLLILTCLASGCATTGIVRGRVLVPDVSARGIGHESWRAKEAEANPVTETVVYAVSERPQRAPAPGSRKPKRPVRKRVLLTAEGFEPRVLAVERGTTVRFRNRDRIYHKLFSISPACRFDLPACGPGQEGSVAFDSAGVVTVYCELHPAGAGSVVVLPDRHFTRPRADGVFLLPPLRSGAYTIKAWHPIYGEATARVEVTSGRQVQVELTF